MTGGSSARRSGFVALPVSSHTMFRRFNPCDCFSGRVCNMQRYIVTGWSKRCSQHSSGCRPDLRFGYLRRHSPKTLHSSYFCLTLLSNQLRLEQTLYQARSSALAVRRQEKAKVSSRSSSFTGYLGLANRAPHSGCLFTDLTSSIKLQAGEGMSISD